MNTLRHALLLFVIGCLIITACSPDHARNSPDDSGTGISSNQNDVPEAEPGAEPAPELESGLEPEQHDEEEPASTPEVEPIFATHYMNEHYIFKPIDEDGQSKVVLLTFDDGPKDEELISQMLEILERHDAKAIFFVNGYRVQAKPELLTMLYEHGHTIGNHSWDHVVLSELSEAEMKQQIVDVQELVEELTGERPKFFRPPHGAGNQTLKDLIHDEGMLYMTWSNGSKDWEKAYQTPAAVVEQVMLQLHRGSNILMHELPWTVEALDTLLTKLTEEGYEFLNPAAIRLEDGASVSPKASGQPLKQ